nr:PREDICTED: leucine-rich repeat-containing protein 23-like [Lepisosteus oculatus]
MEKRLTRQYVEDRGTVIEMLPFTWNIKTEGPHFNIDMKMSRLKRIRFDFAFGSEPREQWPVTGNPERILKFDVSLNELDDLQSEALFPFMNLCELNASLNALKSIPGVNVLPHLVVLNLSYNILTNVRGLQYCKKLATLNVSHNQIRTLTAMPVLSNLMEVHINSNKLDSLEGIQNLLQLQELYVQNNQIRSLLPLSSSLNLCLLDVSKNAICLLSETTQILSGLFRLKQLKMKGNPIAKDNHYTSMIKERTSVQILDNIYLRKAQQHRPWTVLQHTTEGQTKEELVEAARAACCDKLQRMRQEVESTIHYLHSRALNLHEELKEYEESLRLEIDRYCRYLDTIPPEDFSSIDPRKIPEAIEQHSFTKFWERWNYGKRRPEKIPFSDLTKPEEVLQMAALVLEKSSVSTSDCKN